jgi:Tol biopolymer transport system component
VEALLNRRPSALTGAYGSLALIVLALVALSSVVRADAAPTNAKGINGPIVYVSGGSVYVVKSDGTGRRLVVKNAEYPSLSSDGTRIAFDRLKNGAHTVWAAFADGSAAKPVVPGGAAPVWSPDGRKIAYTCLFNNGLTSVCVVNSTGGFPKPPLTPAADNSFGPIWSPDGTKIAFACKYKTLHDICVMPSDGGAANDLTNTESFIRETPLDWSPYETSLSYEGILFHRVQYQGTKQVNDVLDVIHSDGTRLQGIPISGGGFQGANWSPDGQLMVFSQGGSIYVSDAGGGHPTKIASGTYPSWGVGRTVIAKGRFAGKWDKNTYRGSLVIFGSATGPTKLRVQLRVGTLNIGSSTTFSVGTGAFSHSIPIPVPNPRGFETGNYLLSVLDVYSLQTYSSVVRVPR